MPALHRTAQLEQIKRPLPGSGSCRDCSARLSRETKEEARRKNHSPRPPIVSYNLFRFRYRGGAVVAGAVADGGGVVAPGDGVIESGFTVGEVLFDFVLFLLLVALRDELLAPFVDELFGLV